MANRPTSFTTPLYIADVNRLENSRPIRVLIKGFTYYTKISSIKTICPQFIVPEGFCSDGISVPRFFRAFIPTWGKYTQAAVLHDFLYCTHIVSRLHADLIFYESILAITAEIKPEDDMDDITLKGMIMGNLLYYTVRIFGYMPYKNGPKTYRERARKVLERAQQKGYEDIIKLVAPDIKTLHKIHKKFIQTLKN